VLRLAAPTAVLSLLLAGTAAAAGDPMLPLDQVRAGMACTGYSVVKGTAITPFDVTVEDVVAGDPASRAPRILVRVAGPAVDATGVGPGFSGSPIYCPGPDGAPMVAGAISEGVGEYGNKVALATPIEAVVGESVEPPAATRRAPALLRSARPLATPLSVGGLSPGVAAVVRRAAARARVPVLAVPLAPQAGFPAVPLVPGAAMAVGLASGDLTAGAIGTVAYADGDRVWGLGHPFDAVGRRSLFLQDAYVYSVINNPLGIENFTTYKLAAPGHDLGTLTADGLSAVAGRLGVLPARIPMRVFARDLDTGRLEQTVVQLADESAVGLPTGGSALSAVGPLALAQAASTVLGGAPVRQSGSMCVRIEVRERRRPLRFCNTYVGGGGGSEELAGAPLVEDFGKAAGLLDAYEATPLTIERVELNVRLQRGLRQAFLVSLHGPSRVRRGTTVRLRVRLRRAGGSVQTRTIAVPVPRAMPAGRRELVLTGTPEDTGASGLGEDDTLLDLGTLFDVPEPDSDGPTTLAGLARAIERIERYDGVRASFVEPGADPPDPEDPSADVPKGPEGAAARPRRVYRDADLRISGSAKLRVTVR
jgi:hypothetical protein